MPSQNSPKRRPMREQVMQRIRHLIHNGEFLPSQHLAEEELAKLMGTSRTPVREALQSLEKENLVIQRGGGGYEVKPLTVREVRELVGVRAVLESYAVKLAARRMYPELLDRLDENLHQFEKALEHNDTKRLVELNNAFHELFYETADSQLLAKLINDMSDVLHRFRVALLSDSKAARRALRDHRQILQALKKGNREKAVEAAEEHLWVGGRWMLAWMGEESLDE